VIRFAMREPLIELKNVDVRLDGRLVLTRVNWQFLCHQHWAVLGGNGAGKSTFLKLVRGEVWPVPGNGERIYRLDRKEQRTAVGVKEQVPLVSPEAQDQYLQRHWKLRVIDVIYSGFRGTDYLYKFPTPAQRQRAGDVIALLGIDRLLKRNVQSLSTGELRRVLIARALVARPKVLLLDEVCDGLDALVRQRFLETLNGIASAGTQIVYTTHRVEEMIPALTHAAILDQGRIVWRGRADEMPRRSRPSPPRPAPKKTSSVDFSGTKILIRVDNASVYLDRKRVLRDVCWQMQKGENWAVFGANGAGKTTFLKLLAGEVHPALGGHVQRFDLTPRNTLWDIRQRVGFLSPSLQASYREHLTGAEVVASGFFGSVGLRRRVTRRQWQCVADLLEMFRVPHLEKLAILKMSYGELRKILLLRALVHNPAIILCDEPFDGLDSDAREAFSLTLDEVAKNGTRLVTVTHHLTDLPRSTTHGLLLENGRIVCQGRVGELQHHPAMHCLFGHG
jgi:molybdate transport system ATP-binding protein